MVYLFCSCYMAVMVEHAKMGLPASRPNPRSTAKPPRLIRPPQRTAPLGTFETPRLRRLPSGMYGIWLQRMFGPLFFIFAPSELGDGTLGTEIEVIPQSQLWPRGVATTPPTGWSSSSATASVFPIYPEQTQTPLVISTPKASGGASLDMRSDTTPLAAESPTLGPVRKNPAYESQRAQAERLYARIQANIDAARTQAAALQAQATSKITQVSKMLDYNAGLQAQLNQRMREHYDAVSKASSYDWLRDQRYWNQVAEAEAKKAAEQQKQYEREMAELRRLEAQYTYQYNYELGRYNAINREIARQEAAAEARAREHAARMQELAPEVLSTAVRENPLAQPALEAQIDLWANAPGASVSFGRPSRANRRPYTPEKSGGNQKVRSLLLQALRWAYALTELVDLREIVDNNLHFGGIAHHWSLEQKLMMIALHGRGVGMRSETLNWGFDAERFAIEFIANQIEDTLIGRANAKSYNVGKAMDASSPFELQGSAYSGDPYEDAGVGGYRFHSDVVSFQDLYGD